MTDNYDASTVSDPQEGTRILNDLRTEALREVDGAQFVYCPLLSQFSCL
jgi:hypothetical protein